MDVRRLTVPGLMALRDAGRMTAAAYQAEMDRRCQVTRPRAPATAFPTAPPPKPAPHAARLVASLEQQLRALAKAHTDHARPEGRPNPEETDPMTATLSPELRAEAVQHTKHSHRCTDAQAAALVEQQAPALARAFAALRAPDLDYPARVAALTAAASPNKPQGDLREPWPDRRKLDDEALAPARARIAARREAQERAEEAARDAQRKFSAMCRIAGRLFGLSPSEASEFVCEAREDLYLATRGQTVGKSMPRRRPSHEERLLLVGRNLGKSPSGEWIDTYATLPPGAAKGR